MEWELTEIEKSKSIHFDENLLLKDELIARDKNIIDLTNVQAIGTVSFDDGYYDLFFVADYKITLPSTRSLKPVCMTRSITVHEVFVNVDKQTERIDDFILTIENGKLSLDEAVADNILLEIPTQVFTEEEKKENAQFPSGKNWQVISEKEYMAIQEKKRQETSPFKELNGLFNWP